MIESLFTDETVALNVKAKDWEEAVRFCGSLMYEAGYADAKYSDAMVETVRKLGSYIVIAPGLAMPHARPECGARQLGMSLVYLANPVEFGSEEYDPVDILISLCAKDSESHLAALAELMQLMEDEEFLNKIRSGLSKAEVLDYIHKGKFIKE